MEDKHEYPYFPSTSRSFPPLKIVYPYPSRCYPIPIAVPAHIVGKYRLFQTIGYGNFSKVKLAIHSESQLPYAIKCIKKSKLDKASYQLLWNEIKNQRSLDHPNCVKLYEFIETENCFYLVLEYCPGGELFHKIKAHGRLPEIQARFIFRQLLSAVEYAHSKGIIHRDLKAENILYDQRGNVKIADWGFSSKFDPNSQINSSCGSPPYAAPELHLGDPFVGPEIDVWSLGILLYVLVCGNLPFKGSDLESLRSSILKGEYVIPEYLSLGCERLIKRILVRENRPSVAEVLIDPWVTGKEENIWTSDRKKDRKQNRTVLAPYTLQKASSYRRKHTNHSPLSQKSYSAVQVSEKIQK